MFHRTTEQESLYDGLEFKSTSEILYDINREDQKVALAVHECIPQIEAVAEAAFARMNEGGRLFYIGAGTSGRLGILDASECPPTYGIPFDWVIGLIAGGDAAIRKAVEKAEDSKDAAWNDMQEYGINPGDMVIGIAASGTTPYVLHGLKKCNEEGIITACITCNSGSPVSKEARLSIECVVGPEYVTGSTRMKAGTAQKLILNMISTSVMIKLGRVKGNRMINMQLTNEKLVNRGIEMVMHMTGLQREKAESLLKKYGSVKEAVNHINEAG